MPHDRTSKSLAERVDTRYQRQPNRLRRWRLWMALLALLAPLGWLAMAESRGDRRIYQAGPVSTAHQMLAHDCQACHQDAWQPLARLVSGNEKHISTPNAACIKCHDGPIHQQNEIAGTFACADCHREHRGHEALSRVGDRFCAECHADLQTKDGPSQQFVREISRFSQHPEFALKRAVDGAPAAKPDRQLEQIASAASGQWRDKAQILLNHKVHLNGSGIPRRPGDKQLVVMRCEDCHQLDAQRRYMRPISFEKHCGECHADQLNFSAGELAGPLETRLPHRSPEIVRGVMRERLTNYIKAQVAADPDFLGPTDSQRPDVDEANGETDLASERQFFPGQAPREKLTRQAWDWVSDRMHTAEGLLLREKPDAAERGLGCAYCHAVDRDNHGHVQIVPPRIPDRWMGHSQFRHDSHQLLTCTACHVDAPASTVTADILMPGITNCRECHGASASSAGAARSDCVECHGYHGRRDQHFEGTRSIDAVRRGKTSPPAHSTAPSEKAK